MNLITKSIAGAALATLLVPGIAFGHEDAGLKADGALKMRIEKKIEKAEKREHKEHDRDARVLKLATSTAASISKQAQRIQASADVLLSFDARIAALIASSSAEGKAALEAQFAEFKSDATSAKVEAGKAITAAAQVNGSASTTANAALLASAKTDLKESKGFLHDAREALFSILRSLWK